MSNNQLADLLEAPKKLAEARNLRHARLRQAFVDRADAAIESQRTYIQQIAEYFGLWIGNDTAIWSEAGKFKDLTPTTVGADPFGYFEVEWHLAVGEIEFVFKLSHQADSRPYERNGGHGGHASLSIEVQGPHLRDDMTPELWAEILDRGRWYKPLSDLLPRMLPTLRWKILVMDNDEIEFPLDVLQGRAKLAEIVKDKLRVAESMPEIIGEWEEFQRQNAQKAAEQAEKERFEIAQFELQQKQDAADRQAALDKYHADKAALAQKFEDERRAYIKMLADAHELGFDQVELLADLVKYHIEVIARKKEANRVLDNSQIPF